MAINISLVKFTDQGIRSIKGFAEARAGVPRYGEDEGRDGQG